MAKLDRAAALEMARVVLTGAYPHLEQAVVDALLEVQARALEWAANNIQPMPAEAWNKLHTAADAARREKGN